MSRYAQGHLLPGRISPLREVPASVVRPEYVGKLGPREYDGDDRYDAGEVVGKGIGEVSARDLAARLLV